MTRSAEWVSKLHLGQIILLSLVLAASSCGVALGGLALTSKAGACGDLQSARDSLSASTSRLRETDSLLLRFDLSQRDDPLALLLRRRRAQIEGRDTGDGASRPAIERAIVALRAQGADAGALKEYLTKVEQLAENGHFARDSAKSQLAALHGLEADSLYREYVRQTVRGADGTDLHWWHDTSVFHATSLG